MIKQPQTRLNSPPDPDNSGVQDEGDTVAADAVRVPGFVGQPDGKIGMVGNFKRGIINRDLPKNCR